MSRTLIDISRLGTDTTWPSVATEVNGYLQSWIVAANAQVSQHQLRIEERIPMVCTEKRHQKRLSNLADP